MEWSEGKNLGRASLMGRYTETWMRLRPTGGAVFRESDSGVRLDGILNQAR